MRIKDSFTIAWRGVKHAGMRSLLTMLGIVIGIASVILLMSIGQSAQDYILGQIQGIGSNLIFVIPSTSGKSSFSAPSSVYGVIIKTLRDQDVQMLKREPAIDKVGVVSLGQARAVYGGNDLAATYAGANYDYTQAINLPTERGTWFTQDDIDAYAHVAVVGPKVATDLFGTEDPIGKSFRMNNLSLQVIGVMQSKGSFLGSDVDSLIFMPVTVVNSQMLGKDYYDRLVVSGKPEYEVEFIKDRIARVLRANHGITDPNKDDFAMSTQEEVLSVLGNITSIMSIFLSAIAAISLVVGGIGIMNIMLVTVVERTKEIGLRKAVGASNGEVMVQFLWEALMLTLFGGLIGIILGGLTNFLIYIAVNKLTTIGWPFAMPVSAIIMAVVVSSGIGLVFGIYPARQAARKNPIDALHYE